MTTMGLEKRLGSPDDTIAVDRDLLEDLSALKDVFFVMTNSRTVATANVDWSPMDGKLRSRFRRLWLDSA